MREQQIRCFRGSSVKSAYIAAMTASARRISAAPGGAPSADMALEVASGWYAHGQGSRSWCFVVVVVLEWENCGRQVTKREAACHGARRPRHAPNADISHPHGDEATWAGAELPDGAGHTRLQSLQACSQPQGHRPVERWTEAQQTARTPRQGAAEAQRTPASATPEPTQRRRNPRARAQRDGQIT